MSSQPDPLPDPAQSSDFVRNNIPAETDDLELGHIGPSEADPINNGGSDPHSEMRRTGGSPDDPHGGRH